MKLKEFFNRDFRITSMIFLILIVYTILTNKIKGFLLLISDPVLGILLSPILTIAVIGIIFQVFLWSKIGKAINYDFKLNRDRMILNAAYIFVLTILFFMFLSADFVSSVIENNNFDFAIFFITFIVVYFISDVIVLVWDKFRKKK